MTRRVHLMPALFIALTALILALLILASVHVAQADCVIGPGVVCPPDSPYPPRVYIPAVMWR